MPPAYRRVADAWADGGVGEWQGSICSLIAMNLRGPVLVEQLEIENADFQIGIYGKGPPLRHYSLDTAINLSGIPRRQAGQNCP